MSIGIIIQARLSSHRLPEKVISPIFENKSMLDIIIMRLRRMSVSLPIIIATGDSEKNKGLLSFASNNNVGFFSGYEDDVLGRFIQCANQFKLKTILRICADNPFLDYKLAERIINIALSDKYDYVSYSVKNKPAILSHYGFFSEVISLSALIKSHSRTTNDSDKEHVTPYIYNHPEQFSIKLEEAPLEIMEEENIRLTVDTETDFNNAAKILEQLTGGKNNFSYTYVDVLSVVKDMGNDLQQSMAQQIMLNSKS